MNADLDHLEKLIHESGHGFVALKKGLTDAVNEIRARRSEAEMVATLLIDNDRYEAVKWARGVIAKTADGVTNVYVRDPNA